ncbi:MAG: PAS domain-containing protein [Spirochaetales bacterium]|nr:PAS domain-containing protein [Spirochaetales bacterium]
MEEIQQITEINGQPPEPRQTLPSIDEIRNGHIILIAVDKSDRIVYTDNEFAEFLGKDLSGIIGARIQDFLHHYMLGNLSKQELSFVKFAGNYEKPNVEIDFLPSSDGERKTLICEFKYSDELRAIGWEILVTGRDVAIVKQLERLIEVMQETSRQLLSGNFDMAMRLDSNRKIKSMNSCCEREMGIKKNDITGKDITTILSRERDRVSLNQAFEQASAFHNVYNLRVDLKINDRILPTLVNVQALRDSFNNDIGFALVLRNIEEETKKDSVLKRLEAIDKMNALGELAVGISHQIKNYINAISSGILLLEMDISSRFGELTDDQHVVIDHLNDVKNHLAKLTWLTKHLLAFANNQKTPVESLGNVNSVLQSVYNLVHDTVKKRNAVIELQLADKLPVIFFSPIHLEQTILNIVNNAVDALPAQDGLITVKSFKSEKKWVTITISDNGCGIPEEMKQKIFDIFETTKPVGKGTGLGLYLAHQFISFMKGTISVDSTVGKGTTFTIRLPISKIPGIIA